MPFLLIQIHTVCLCTPDEVIKAAADLEKHVICILDVCCLGEDKVEVFLIKVYETTEADATNQT